jgi:sporulation protein YlmC with PRC-barrel domain
VDQRIVYLSRLTRLPLLGADGADIGRIVDAVIDLGSKPPRVNGIVVQVQRRRVFVGIGRVGEIASDGARLRRGSVNLRHFELRPGERLLAGELLSTRMKGERVIDVGLSPTPGLGGWEVATIALSPRRVPGLGPRGVPGLRPVQHVRSAAQSGDPAGAEPGHPAR